MGRKFWRGFGLLASILAGAGVAGAADLAVKAPVYKAPPVILSDWAGFYLGVHGGYGWGKTTFDSPFEIANASPKGGLFGGHAGYNWQYGSVVTGLEVDFDGADITDSGTIAKAGCAGIRVADVVANCTPVSLSRTMKFDELATARARLGYILLPNLLAYGTAGAGWGHSTLTGALTVGPTTLSADANANNFGWVAGAGLEYKLWSNFIARAEYLHYDFATTAYSFPVLVSPNAGSTIDVVRGGLSYKF
jgi:outer membrane immunogenic protein